MPDYHAPIQKYLDDELTPAENRQATAHLATCAPCRAELEQQQHLSAQLQLWTLPPGLSTLAVPLHLPAQTPTNQLPGLFAWLSGLFIILAYFMTRAIFLVADPLSWVTATLTTIGIGVMPQEAIPTLWQPAILQFLGDQLGNASDIALVFMVPTLLYALAIGAMTILYFTWISLNWGNLSNTLNRSRA